MPQATEQNTGEPPSIPRYRLPEFKGEEWIIRGIPASSGLYMGTIVKYDPRFLLDTTTKQSVITPAQEIHRFTTAVEECTNEIRSMIESTEVSVPSISPILEAQLMMLHDIGIRSAIETSIHAGLTAEAATIAEFEKHESLLKRSKDQMLRDRALDIEHVKQRIVQALHNATLIRELPSNAIIVAPSLTPSEILRFHNAGMQGFVAEFGGLTSHMCIIARTLNIPAVINIKNLVTRINGDEPIIIDGFRGEVVINPKPETIERFHKRSNDLSARRKKLGKYAHLPSETSDGKHIALMANVDTPDDIDCAVADGADGVGLVRTEHLVLRLQRLPSEEEQVQWYSQLAERAYPLPITLRAFDLGADKSLNFVETEENPALGLRGLRLLLRRPEFFRTQIRAVLRASCHKNVRLLLPMVTGVREFMYARDLVHECMKELSTQEYLFDAHLPVGAMIETPAAAVMAQELASVASFFSVGTNDLTQYTLAADRINPLVKDIFDAFNPAVLRLVRMTAAAAHRYNIPVAVCGDIASHPAATNILLGLGITELSVSTSILLELKKRIRSLSYKKSCKLAERLLNLTTGTEIRQELMNIKHADHKIAGV